MLLAADALRVALATTHLPLRAVSDAITPALLATTLASCTPTCSGCGASRVRASRSAA